MLLIQLAAASPASGPTHAQSVGQPS
uniref:Uncharacterized protein n=1 Tax=Arundo donax TaxID=35708 RepID=A0A0A8YSD5_ARUDO